MAREFGNKGGSRGGSAGGRGGKPAGRSGARAGGSSRDSGRSSTFRGRGSRDEGRSERPLQVRISAEPAGAALVDSARTVDESMVGVRIPARLQRSWDAVRQEMQVLDPQYASR